VRRIIFREDLANQILAGVKTETRRVPKDSPRSPWYRERCAFEVGGTYAVCAGRGTPTLGLIVVEAVDMVRLGAITHDGAVAEGFSDVRDFMHGWTKINGSWNTHEQVWRLTFHAETNAI
jgi:hypothetical protein